MARELSLPRCDGRCCALFCLPYSVEELRHRAETLEDGAAIATMVRPVQDAAARARRFGLSPLSNDSQTGHWYTCVHWNEWTRECMNYAERPAMCRRFPYGRTCNHCGAVRVGEPAFAV